MRQLQRATPWQPRVVVESLPPQQRGAPIDLPGVFWQDTEVERGVNDDIEARGGSWANKYLQMVCTNVLLGGRRLRKG